MFHLDIDGVEMGARHLQALGIRIYPRPHAPMAIIDGLAVFPQLDHLVDPARLVIAIHARWLGVRMQLFIAAHRNGFAGLRLGRGRRRRQHAGQ